MYRIQVPRLISQIISFLYLVRFWNRCDEATAWERRIKTIFSTYYLLFPISLAAGALASDTRDEMIFLIELSLMAAVLLIKLLLSIWRKEEFLELLNQVCVYVIEDHITFTLVNNKLKKITKLLAFFVGVACFNIITCTFIIPFMGSEKTLFLQIGFPLDWKNDELAYWVAFIFAFTEATIASIAFLFSMLIWYLMFHCGLRYVVLGQQIKTIGAVKAIKVTSKERKLTDAAKDNLFRQDLHRAITEQQNLTALINHADMFLSKVFVVQLGTSALCICCSVYCLAFNRGANLFELAVNLVIFIYNIFDIFMVMFFGNEIKLGSDRLSYCLFESEWTDRSQSIKTEVIIFGEFLMKPMEFVVLKLYSLTLETFTMILNSAYSMFNILQNFK